MTSNYRKFQFDTSVYLPIHLVTLSVIIIKINGSPSSEIVHFPLPNPWEHPLSSYYPYTLTYYNILWKPWSKIMCTKMRIGWKLHNIINYKLYDIIILLKKGHASSFDHNERLSHGFPAKFYIIPPYVFRPNSHGSHMNDFFVVVLSTERPLLNHILVVQLSTM